MQKEKEMKKVAIGGFLALVFIAFGTGVAFAVTLKADYQFQGNFNSSVAGAPALTNLTGSGGANSFQNDVIDGYTRQTLRFPFNSGLSLNIAGLIPNNTYTFVGLFRLDNVSGFRCIAACDPVNESGAYVVDGRLVFESTANTPFVQNTYIQVVVVRDPDGTVRAYRDGGFRVNQPDPAGDFIFDTNVMQLFQDPLGNASAGNIARLRVYDGALTTTQVRALDRVANATGGGDQSILFTAGRDGFNEIYSMNADGSNQRRLTNTELPIESEPAWSHDGQKIVYTRQEASGSPVQIWTMNADGSGQTRLTNTTTRDQNPAWSPDGQKILFARCDSSGLCDLYTMNPNGTGQVAMSLVNTANDEYAPTFSPDGAKIVFSCSTGGTAFVNQNICMANSDGSGRQQLTNTVSPASNDSAVFAPNGLKIAFDRASNAADSTTTEIYTMNANGTAQTSLTNNAVADFIPVWSADGNSIAFTSGRDTGSIRAAYTMNSNGSSVKRLTFGSKSDIMNDWRRSTVATHKLFDYDGDGKSDVSVFRQSNNYWYLNRSQAGFAAFQFGAAADVLTPADFTGDGKTDVAVFRPSVGTWFIMRSEDNTFYGVGFGTSGDIPAPADFDGDGKADQAVFRPSNGTWYLQQSTAGFSAVGFGIAEDKPAVGDFDGDGKADIAVYRPSSGYWYRLNSSNGAFFAVQFGTTGDKIVPADYTGDGKTDVAVWRPSNGIWYVLRSEDLSFYGAGFGVSSDLPAPGDYDGDGKADIAVYRPSVGTWYMQQSTSGFNAVPFGIAEDRPTPNAFVY